jgi:hypothetical protein
VRNDPRLLCNAPGEWRGLFTFLIPFVDLYLQCALAWKALARL